MRTYNIEIGFKNFLVTEVNKEEIPNDLKYSDDYGKYYIVRLYGDIVLYLAKGHEKGPEQIVIWYAATKNFHRSYGTTFKEAIELAMEDVWKHIGIKG